MSEFCRLDMPLFKPGDYTIRFLVEDTSPQCRRNGHWFHLDDSNTLRCIGCCFEGQATGKLDHLRWYLAQQKELRIVGGEYEWGTW